MLLTRIPPRCMVNRIIHGQLRYESKYNDDKEGHLLVSVRGEQT